MRRTMVETQSISPCSGVEPLARNYFYGRQHSQQFRIYGLNRFIFDEFLEFGPESEVGGPYHVYTLGRGVWEVDRFDILFLLPKRVDTTTLGGVAATSGPVTSRSR